MIGLIYHGSKIYPDRFMSDGLIVSILSFNSQSVNVVKEIIRKA